MSDFDKEAEREKLRQQFESDKRKRQQTERMSELLLKGATMTNKHCDDCGSPIFRWEGEEFCPSCSSPEAQEQAQAEAETEPTDAETRAEGAAGASQPGQPTEASRESGTPRPESEGAGIRPAGTTETAENGTAATQPTPPAGPVEPRAPATSAPAETSAEDGAAPVTAARASLARTLADVARRAEATDDLSRKRDLLAAAKEAAEALEAAGRADR